MRFASRGNLPEMGRCVIIGGAEISNYEFVREYLRPEDFCIFCDCGLEHEAGLGVRADLVVGDFDSHELPVDISPEKLIVLPREKNDTDTMYAIRDGIRRGFEEFLLIGVIGARLDHTLVNVYGLLKLAMAGKFAKILDDYSEMEIILPGDVKRVSGEFRYFSLVSISGIARGVNITGAKFALEDGEIRSEYQFATSNEVLPAHVAEICC